LLHATIRLCATIRFATCYDPTRYVLRTGSLCATNRIAMCYKPDRYVLQTKTAMTTVRFATIPDRYAMATLQLRSCRVWESFAPQNGYCSGVWPVQLTMAVVHTVAMRGAGNARRVVLPTSP